MDYCAIEKYIWHMNNYNDKKSTSLEMNELYIILYVLVLNMFSTHNIHLQNVWMYKWMNFA